MQKAQNAKAAPQHHIKTPPRNYHHSSYNANYTYEEDYERLENIGLALYWGFLGLTLLYGIAILFHDKGLI